MVPPYQGVLLVEYKDRIALKPIAFYREVLGLCKIPGGDTDFQPWEGIHPLVVILQKQGDIWLIITWRCYEDGSEEPIAVTYIAEATEAEVREAYKRQIEFRSMSKEYLQRLEECVVVPESEKDYIADRFPELPPDPSNMKDYDLYQARLKVAAGMSPKTVQHMQAAEATDDPMQKEYHFLEAVSAYYAEMAHYWNSEVVKEWQRTNPIAREWIREFAGVFAKPRKELDKIDHEVVLNWLRRGYNLMTAEELAAIVLKETGQPISPEAIKKRRERLGLTTERSPGPRPNSER